MYLRRFAVGTGTGHRLSVSLVSDLRRSFMQVTENVGASKGFYWGTTPDGIPARVAAEADQNPSRVVMPSGCSEGAEGSAHAPSTPEAEP